MAPTAPPPAPAGAGPGEAAMTAEAPRAPTSRARRATPEIDDGRRGKGALFGAFKPADGEALTVPDAGRTIAHHGDFLARVAAWIPPTIARISAILDNWNVHRAPEVLLCSLAPPRWECVFPPQYAPDLNLSAPWWKV